MTQDLSFSTIEEGMAIGVSFTSRSGRRILIGTVTRKSAASVWVDAPSQSEPLRFTKSLRLHGSGGTAFSDRHVSLVSEAEAREEIASIRAAKENARKEALAVVLEIKRRLEKEGARYNCVSESVSLLQKAVNRMR